MVPMHAQLVCEHWVLDGPPWPKMVGFCDLLGTPYAPVSKILSVNVKESTGIREDAPENFVTLYIDTFGIKMCISPCS